MESVRRSQSAKPRGHSPPEKFSRSGDESEPTLAAEWQRFLDGLLDGVLVVNSKRRCVFGNTSARGLLELTALEINGRKLSEFVVQEDGQEIEPQPISANANRETRVGRFTRGDQTHFTGEYLAQSLPADCDHGMMVTFRPKARADERRKIAREFTSAIAHDLNNLLSPVIMATEVLRASPSQETTELALGIIEQAAKRGVDLVSRLVQSSRELPTAGDSRDARDSLRSGAPAGSTGAIQTVPQPGETRQTRKKGQQR